jgi:hypothetical protein
LGNENVEQIWYALWLIKAIVAIVSLCFFGAVALICKRLLRRIPWNLVKWRSVLDTMVHSFGNPIASEHRCFGVQKQSVAARAGRNGRTVRDVLTHTSKRKKVNPHG